MIRIRHQTFGGHTHLEVRSGSPASQHLALAGRLVLDNDEAETLLDTLRSAPSTRVQLIAMDDKGEVL